MTEQEQDKNVGHVPVEESDINDGNEGKSVTNEKVEVKPSDNLAQHDKPSTRHSHQAATFEEKQRQLMLADCQRLKKKMSIAKSNINRPPLKPFNPYLFNSLEPYYNQYLINYTANELKGADEDEYDYGRPATTYGQRATSLGIVEPQISWKMDNVPGPYTPPRLPGDLSRQRKWKTNMPGRDETLGSTRLPPFPKPVFPKIKVPEYQASKMDYSQVLKFRDEMDKEVEKLNKKKIHLDYNRTLKDWERMNLSELKELPPYSRYHVNKAIKTYFGTSKGAVKAVNSLSKQLDVE